MQDESPRALGDAAEQQRRDAMLYASHIASLTAFAKNLPGTYVPNFDPLDGGVNADILFLFEKPGPKTSRPEGGSGFISRDNNDATAAATKAFMAQAGIDRERTVIWNAIPDWNGTIKLSQNELEEGLRSLEALLALLPRVHTAVLVGKQAAKARNFLEGKGLKVVCSDH